MVRKMKLETDLPDVVSRYASALAEQPALLQAGPVMRPSTGNDPFLVSLFHTHTHTCLRQVGFSLVTAHSDKLFLNGPGKEATLKDVELNVVARQSNLLSLFHDYSTCHLVVRWC